MKFLLEISVKIPVTNMLVKTVSEPYFSYLESGVKTVEGRLFKEDWTKVSVGDVISITNSLKNMVLSFTVTRIVRTVDFAELFEEFGLELLPNATSAREAAEFYRAWYSDADVAKYGVIGLCLEMIE